MTGSSALEGLQVLADLQALGGFSALVAAPESGALPWAQVLADDALTTRFASVRAALAASTGMEIVEVDPRVAVSATQVGLASRLWSPALAAAVLHHWVPDLSPDALVASPEHGGAVPLGVRDPEAGYAVSSLSEAAELIGDLVIDGSIATLNEACSSIGQTADRVLISNAASSLVGAARVLAQQRPGRAAAAWALARDLLGHPRLAQGGAVRAPDGLPAGIGGVMADPHEIFVRSGCCLFYRLPEHGLCPDCVLAVRAPEQVTPGH